MKRLLRPFLAALVLAVVAPLASPALAQNEPTVLAETQFCADLGRKQPGEPADAAMADHIAERFAAGGLTVTRESFHVPVFDLHGVTIESVAPEATAYDGAAFAYSGTGTVEADVVYVGVGRESDYAGVDATGRIVMVDRELTFHRSAQLNEIVRQGGVAMLYVSASPDNLVQVGAVRFAQEPPAPIPTLTVGADDGAVLKDQAEAGTLRMRLGVDADRVDAVGVNVLGTKVGTTYPDRLIVVGGHYDSWFAGAVDNCSAIGSMLQLVENTADVDFAYTVVFAAWDAEEIGLVGSYDWVMKHQDLIPDIVVNENLEMTSAATQAGSTELPLSLVNLIFGTTSPAMNAVIAESMARTGHQAAPTTANGVRQVQGGLIPTDLQPFYTSGAQGFSTFSNSTYYHTTQDDTAHIPDGSHERVTDFLEAFLRDVQNSPPEALAFREIPTVDVTAPASVTAGEPVEVTIQVTQVDGSPITGKQVDVLVNENDHWPVVDATATEVGDGTYRYALAGEHVRAGELWFTVTVQDDLYAAEGYASVAVASAGATTTSPVAGATGSAPSMPATGGGLAALGLVLAVGLARRRRDSADARR